MFIDDLKMDQNK